MHQLFNAGTGFCQRQIFQQCAQLHDKRHFAGSEILMQTHRRDQRDGDQHVSFDIEPGDQSDNRLQHDGNAAQYNGDPCRRKGERYIEQRTEQGDAGDHKQSDVLFRTAQFQERFQLFHTFFHSRCLLSIPYGVYV